jgi:hypothetical protein
MELKTFGDGLQFGIESEAVLQLVYEQIANTSIEIESKEVILSFVQACKKRKLYLETLYKESIYSDMDTGVFQPIGSLDANQYAIVLENIYVADQSVSGNLMIAEKNMELFYNDFALKIKSQRNAVALRFRKMAEENSKRAIKLNEFRWM